MAFCTNCGANVAGAFCQQCGQPASPTAAAPSIAPPPVSASSGFPPPAGAVSQRRKTSPLVWVLVIVLGLFVVGGIVVVGAGIFVARTVQKAGLDPDLMRRNPGLAVSKLIAAVNPDLEVISLNEGKGVITVKEKSSGKVITLNFDDVKKGRIVVHDDVEGKMAALEIGASADKFPSWIPAYPGAKVEGTFAVNSGDGSGGSFSYKTEDAPAKVVEFYQESLGKAGFKINTTATTSESSILAAEDEATKRSLMITATRGSVHVIFGVKK